MIVKSDEKLAKSIFKKSEFTLVSSLMLLKLQLSSLFIHNFSKSNIKLELLTDISKLHKVKQSYTKLCKVI